MHVHLTHVGPKSNLVIRTILSIKDEISSNCWRDAFVEFTHCATIHGFHTLFGITLHQHMVRGGGTYANDIYKCYCITCLIRVIASV